MRSRILKRGVGSSCRPIIERGPSIEKANLEALVRLNFHRLQLESGANPYMRPQQRLYHVFAFDRSPVLVRTAFARTGLFAGLLLFAGCSLNGMDLCYDTTEEPLFAIVAATDQLSGAQIAEVTIRDVQYMGAPFGDVADLLASNTPTPAHGVTVEGQVLRCRITCTFGRVPGDYTFTVGATDFRDSIVTVNADYRVEEDGCRRSLRTGTLLTLRLTRI